MIPKSMSSTPIEDGPVFGKDHAQNSSHRRVMVAAKGVGRNDFPLPLLAVTPRHPTRPRANAR
jgi:hypothetical protein